MSNKKVADVITLAKADSLVLDQNIRQYLNMGYVALGGTSMSISNGSQWFAITMVKYEEKPANADDEFFSTEH